MSPLLHYLWQLLVVRPVVLIALGINVRRRHLLTQHCPAIIAANHNSHLDTLVLTSIFPLRNVCRVRPVGAADYFLRNRLLAWFALRVVGLIPLHRGKVSAAHDPLEPCCDALERGETLLLFPEGSRGEPEHMSPLKNGVAHLAKRFPLAPIIPVYMQGLGKALPKGEGLLVPFFCDVWVGEPLYWQGDKRLFMEALAQRMQALAGEAGSKPWQ